MGKIKSDENLPARFVFEKSKKGPKKKNKMNKSNLNMSVGAIPVGGGQRTIGYDVYQNKPIGAKKGSMQNNVN